MKNGFVALTALFCVIGTDAYAHKIIEPGFREKIARGGFSASPDTEWNRLQQKGGKYQEIWTVDGDHLNQIIFFGGIPVGSPLYKERDKKNAPLPKVTANMLITDIPVLLETTYRTRLHLSQMSIGKQEPAEIDGRRGIKFEYSFVDPNDLVERHGEAIGAIVDDRLYLVVFEAPALYFFSRDVDSFRQIAATVKIRR